MLAPVLDVVDLEAEPLEIGDGHADMVVLGAGTDVLRDDLQLGPLLAEVLLVAPGAPHFA